MSFQTPSYNKIRIPSGLVLGAIIVLALAAFEAFNYSTTQYALGDLLGPLTFLGLPWATILSIAFCGIDFAGIARLFTPSQDHSDPSEVWYLFGAWLLAATMNAILTWWGVSMAIVSHTVHSNAFIPSATISQVVPIFVAIMVWIIRILIIGTISVSVDRYQGRSRRSLGVRGPLPAYSPVRQPLQQQADFSSRSSVVNSRTSPSSRSADDDEEMRTGRLEPTYHSMAATARPAAYPKASVREPENRHSKAS